MTVILVYILAFVFVTALIGSWVSNLFVLSGNWLIVALAGGWFYFTDASSAWHIGLGLIILLTMLAGIGELIEFGALILGNKKVGGSELAGFGGLAGSLVGGFAGIFIGIPILNPLLGMVEYTGRLFRNGKTRISVGARDVLERIGSNPEFWCERIKKMLKTNQLRGCFFASKNEVMKEAAEKRGVRTVNLCPQ